MQAVWKDGEPAKSESLVFAQNNVITIHDLLDEHVVSALKAEGMEVQSSASKKFITRTAYIANGRRLVGHSNYTAGGPGPHLQRLHRYPDLLRKVSDISGQRLVPTRSAYNFYSPGSFVGLHNDVDACSVAVLITLEGTDSELIVHPELDSLSTNALLQLAIRFGSQPPGGESVKYPERGAVLIRGGKLLHRRPVSAGTVMLAALCYDSILPAQ